VVEWEDEDEDELVESHLCLTYPPLLATWLPTRGLWRWRRRRIHRRGWRGAAGVPQPKKHKVRGEATVPHPSKEPTTEEGKLLIEPNGVE
jgi:hypothetical protein